MSKIKSLVQPPLLVVLALALAPLAGCNQATQAPSASPGRISDAQLMLAKPPNTRAVIVHARGYGTGTITISPSGASCEAYDWGDSAHDSQVCWAFLPIGTPSATINASPTNGSTFTGWGVDGCVGSLSADCVVDLDRDRIVHVGFWPGGTMPRSEFRLRVDVLGFVDGQVTGTFVPSLPGGLGLACQVFDPEDRVNVRRTCSAVVPVGTQVTLAATPLAGGSAFSGWGGNCSGTGTCTVDMDRDLGVTAGFTRSGAGGGGGGGTVSPWTGTWTGAACGGAVLTVTSAGAVAYQDTCGAQGVGTVTSDGTYALSGLGCGGQNFDHQGSWTMVSGTLMHADADLRVSGGPWLPLGGINCDFTRPAVSPPVISSFTASPASITAGQASTLAWNVAGATTLSVDQGVGAVGGSSIVVNPVITTTYRLTATNAGGSSSATVTVTAMAPVHLAYDLYDDWSDSQNPFPGGAWRLYKAPGQLFTTNMNWGLPGADVPGWVDARYPATAHVPIWIRVAPGTSLDAGQMPAGSVMMHGAESGRTGTEFSYVTWTSPHAGLAVVSGGAWNSKTNDRPMTWSLRKNGVEFSRGDMVYADPYSSSNPFLFTLGSGGPGAVQQTVAAGDTLELWIYRTTTSTWANGVGVNLGVDLYTGAQVGSGAGAGTVGVQGGTISNALGAAVTVPAGALDGDIVISFAPTLAAAPPGVVAITPVYQFSPEGLVFSSPVTITLPVPAGVTTAAVYWERPDKSGFECIGGRVDPVTHTITVEVAYLGRGVVGQASPTRTVSGSAMTTYISATSRVSLPTPYFTAPAALVADGAGGVRSIQGVAGTGPAAGTFTITDVPVGEYLLNVGGDYRVTDSSSPNLSVRVGGRPASELTPLTSGTILDVTLSNLAPWQATDWLEFFSTETNSWGFDVGYWWGNPRPAVGNTTAVLSMDLLQLNGSGNPRYQITGSAGHRAYIAQLSSAVSQYGYPYKAMARLVELPSFDLLDGSTASVAGLFVDYAQASSTALDVRFSAWKAAFDQYGPPSATFYYSDDGGQVGVLAQPGQSEDGFYSSNADLLLLEDQTGTDVLTGAMHFGSPVSSPLAGSWGIIGSVRWIQPVFYQLPGTTGPVALYSSIQWSTSLPELERAAIYPPIGMPRSATVAGVPFYAGGSGVGLTPVIAWSAPSFGAVTGYRVNIWELRANASNLTRSYELPALRGFTTPHTSMTIPAGVLQAGRSYVFRIRAFGGAPGVAGLNEGHSSITSGIFTP